MTRENDNRLNVALREWLDRTEEGVDREALKQRVSRAVEDVTPLLDRGRPSDWRRRRATRVKAAMAVVATVLLVVFVWQLRNRPSPLPPPRGNEPALELLAQLDVDELEHRLALLDQLDDLFEDRWEWMVECGNHVDMHVAAMPRSAAASDQVAVRLAVLVRDDPDESFRVQEKTFVFTREEQAVEAVLEDGVSRKLYFWAFPVDDGLFTYDVDLQTTKPREMSLSSSGVVVSGRPTKILSFEQGGSEYRVYLVIIPAPKKTGKA